jgi:hypothetical protein
MSGSDMNAAGFLALGRCCRALGMFEEEVTLLLKLYGVGPEWRQLRQ